MSLDINRMTRAELIALKGIAEELADAIIARRREAPFTSLDELVEISGIDQKRLALLRSQGVTCGSSDEPHAGATFACRSCGRILPVSERETSNRFNQHICTACYLNLNLWTMPMGGA